MEGSSMASQTQSVAEFVRKEVPDWDDEIQATARFKAFSGQRSDWEPQFCFWRDLIIKIAHHFCIFRLSPSQMKNHWFNRGGLLPLCLDQVLLEMYKAGDIVRVIDLGHPTRGQLSLLFKKVIQFAGVLRSSTPDAVLNDDLIVLKILKDKAADVVKALSESQWTSSCIITVRKFEDLCAAHDEASAILSYLSGCGKAQYISIKKKELIEGVKVSLTSAAVSSITSLDCDILQLIWTTEKLQKQLDVLDQRYAVSRKSALAALKSGNKKVALRHAREHKLACENREQIVLLLSRVEEVLHVIVDMESTRKVSEAMKIGAQAMKENRASFEELRLCLLEVDESVYSQKQFDEALGDLSFFSVLYLETRRATNYIFVILVSESSCGFILQRGNDFALTESTSYADAEDDDIKEELKKLELEIRAEDSLVSASNYHIYEAERKAEVSETADSVGDAILGLKLADCC